MVQRVPSWTNVCQFNYLGRLYVILPWEFDYTRCDRIFDSRNSLFSLRLKTDFKAVMKMADNFWTSLPDMLCSDIAAEKNNPSECWNGAGKGR